MESDEPTRLYALPHLQHVMSRVPIAVATSHRVFAKGKTQNLEISSEVAIKTGFHCRICQCAMSGCARLFCTDKKCANFEENLSYQELTTGKLKDNLCRFCTSRFYWQCEECWYSLCEDCFRRNSFLNFLESLSRDLIGYISSFLKLSTALQFEITCKKFYSILVKTRTELVLQSGMSLTERDVRRICSRYGNPTFDKLILSGVISSVTPDTAYHVATGIIHHFPSLTYLDLSHNTLDLDSLSPLLELESLTYLSLSFTKPPKEKYYFMKFLLGLEKNKSLNTLSLENYKADVTMEEISNRLGHNKKCKVIM